MVLVPGAIITTGEKPMASLKRIGVLFQTLKKRKIFGKTSRAKSAIPFVWIYMLVGGIKATQSIVNHRGNAPIWSSLLESAMA